MEFDDIIIAKPEKSKKTSKKHKISEKKILNIINDIFLTNYWCTRKNMVNITSDYIVGLDEINQWFDYFKDVRFKRINRISLDSNRNYPDKRLNIGKIESFLIHNCKPVYDILNIGRGKISLCGGAIISILQGGNPHDYDLFFHSDSVDEIDDIFNECMYYFANLVNADIRYSRSRYLMNVSVDYGIFYGDLQFIKRVYKTKEQVLFGFDLAPCRLGYNPKDGVFATICGAMAFSMNAFALDISNRSKSFGHRLHKYSYNNSYSILLPQLQSDIINDNSMELFDNIKICRGAEGNNRFLIESYEDTPDDYKSNNCNLNYIIKQDYGNLTFYSDDLKIISELSDEFIEKEMIDNNSYFVKPSSRENITRANSKEFLNDKYKEFVLAYFVDEDDEKADTIWQEKVKYYIDIAKKSVRNNDKNYYKGWKYLNPGSRGFGQNHPVNNPPTSYYKPLVIGINMDKFQAFMDCRKNIEYISNLPDELFKLICKYWLKYDVEDARQRLLSLMINDKIKKEPSIKDLELTWDRATICDVSFY